MTLESLIEPQKVKQQSEKIIQSIGGETLDWLPILELPQPRLKNEIINRALVLNAMFQLHIKAPKYYIEDWIVENDLEPTLTQEEISILTSPNELTEEEHYDLYWSLESLWAIAWATNLIPELPYDKPVGDTLAGLSPNLQLNEDGEKYINNMHLRPIKTLFEMLDLYYRLHWWTHTYRRQNKPTGNIELEVIMARRKALEWILYNDMAWDEVDLSV